MPILLNSVATILVATAAAVSPLAASQVKPGS